MNKQSGFTLLEMLIAISLMTIMLGLLFSASRTLSGQTQSGIEQVQMNDDIRLVTQFVRRLISQTSPIVMNQGNSHPVLFSGAKHQLGFVSTLPAHAGGNSLYWVELMLKENQLVMNYQPLLSLLKNHKNIQQITLLNGVASLDFSYAELHNNITPKWHSAWRKSQQLPPMISVTVAQKNQAEKYPIVVSLPVQVTRMRDHLSVQRSDS